MEATNKASGRRDSTITQRTSGSFVQLLNENWRKTLKPSPIGEEEIDLWGVFLTHDQPSMHSFFDSLSEDEKHKANRFVFAKDRDAFVAGRGSLRKILGGYLDCRPEQVRFSYNRFGKPGLAAPEDCGLRFNVSHSRGIGVVAVTQDREVGVDIEYVDPDFDVLSVAAGAFFGNEVARLKSLPEESRTAAFFEGWTRKEASLKAMGDGLSSSSEQQLAVSAIQNEQRATFTTTVSGKVTHWTLISLQTGDEFKAALAVEGNIVSLRYFRLANDDSSSCTSRR